jgi:hypothetical protein
MTYARKTDSVQAEIVVGLRRCGLQVFVIGRPVDLLVGVGKYWRLLEVKTPQKNGRKRPRKDQQRQDEFIRVTNTPVVTSLEQALRALKE